MSNESKALAPEYAEAEELITENSRLLRSIGGAATGAVAGATAVGVQAATAFGGALGTTGAWLASHGAIASALSIASWTIAPASIALIGLFAVIGGVIGSADHKEGEAKAQLKRLVKLRKDLENVSQKMAKVMAKKGNDEVKASEIRLKYIPKIEKLQTEIHKIELWQITELKKAQKLLK